MKERSKRVKCLKCFNVLTSATGNVETCYRCDGHFLEMLRIKEKTKKIPKHATLHTLKKGSFFAYNRHVYYFFEFDAKNGSIKAILHDEENKPKLIRANLTDKKIHFSIFKYDLQVIPLNGKEYKNGLKFNYFKK